MNVLTVVIGDDKMMRHAINESAGHRHWQGGPWFPLHPIRWARHMNDVIV